MEGVVYFGLTEDDFLGFKEIESVESVDSLMSKVDDRYAEDKRRRQEDWEALQDKLICDL